MTNYSLGCRLPVDEWVWLNRSGIFATPELRKFVAPFPPPDLMHNVSGLETERDFASHGADIYLALTRAAQRPLTEFEAMLDFGCGCGRLARMFKGHPHEVHGCDVDPRHVVWAKQNLTHMKVAHTSVQPPLPYCNDAFDAIISISVFTHLNERSHLQFLVELHRICKPGGQLFLTVHGAHALERAVHEHPIREMLCVMEEPFQEAREAFTNGEHAFILQKGHLTNTPRRVSLRNLFFGRKMIVREPFEYGITFIPETYLRDRWADRFEFVAYLPGAIHSFQDIAVLTPKK